MEIHLKYEESMEVTWKIQVIFPFCGHAFYRENSISAFLFSVRLKYDNVYLEATNGATRSHL